MKKLTAEQIGWLVTVNKDYEELMDSLGWNTDTAGAKVAKRFWLKKIKELLTDERNFN